jgi:hypothetical protein
MRVYPENLYAGMINQALQKNQNMEWHNKLYPTNVATCHGMSNLRFYPSSGAAKHHEGLSLLSHVSIERIIEINIFSS